MTREEIRQNIQLETEAGNEAIDAAKNLVGAKLLARLQKYRERSDYGLVTVFTKEDVEAELKEVDAFLQHIQDYLKI